MKQRLTILNLFSILLVFLCSGSFAASYEIKSPPPSLEKYYPPKSSGLEFTSRMNLMSQSITAILLNLKSGNVARAGDFSDRLYTLYKETAEMVPEWKDLFKVERVKALKESLVAGDKEGVKNALKELKLNCSGCHNENRIPVWSQYHWPSFKEIVITDPESEDDFKYVKYMENISHTFNSIPIFFEEKDFRKAGRSLRSFKARFMELKSTCSKCHINDDVKRIFFGNHITNALELLKGAISGEDQGEFNKNMDVIRKRGCKMCHLTHLTYSIIKTAWKEK